MTELNKIEDVNLFESPKSNSFTISPVKSKKLEHSLAVKNEENKKLKMKLKELDYLTIKLRKDYHKELTHYK